MGFDLGGFASNATGFGMAKGLLGVGQGGPPQMDVAALDQGTKDLMAAKNARAARDKSAFAGELTAGAEGGKSAQYTPERMNQENAALGMNNNPALSQALSQRSQRLFDSNMSNINAQARAEAPIRQFNETSMTGQNALQQNNANFQNTNIANANLQNKLAARNQVIGNVLGAAGTAGGFMLGGPTGAKAGGGAGMSLTGKKQMAGEPSSGGQGFGYSSMA